MSAPFQTEWNASRVEPNGLEAYLRKDGTEMNISKLNMSEIPTHGYPPSLCRLDASMNRLTQLPEELTELIPALSQLLVSNNSLRRLPDRLGDAAQLQSVRASHNMLSSLSFVRRPLPLLIEMHADRNQITDVPAALWCCPQLKAVSLCANRLHGIDALHMSGVTSGATSGVSGSMGVAMAVAPLEHLDLGENRLGSMPPLDLYPLLREVHLQQNGIRDLPVEHLAPLHQLQTFDVSMNDVHQLPPELALLPLLQNLTIVGNPIRSIPQSVQQRGSTAVIDLLKKRLPE